MIATAHLEHRATAGLLAETGTAMIWLMLHDHVPDVPPEPLRQFANPVHDRDGELIDWRFRPPQLADPPDVQRDMAAFEAFRHWRAQWTTERAIADAATVKVFLAWADRHAHVTALHLLSLHHAHIDADAVPRVCWQIAQLRNYLERAGDGLGILDADRGTVIRGFPPIDDQPLTLLANLDAQLQLVESQLTLATRRHGTGSVEPFRIAVKGWQVGDDDVRVITPDGEINIRNAPVAALLTQLSAGHPAIRLAPVPLKTLFAPMLASLTDITRLANTGRAKLYVRRGLT
jgi:hypothetical protein